MNTIQNIEVGFSDLFSTGTRAETLLNAIDWQNHCLGLPQYWQSALRTALGICLNAPEPGYILWGESRTFFCNDAWLYILRETHAEALGQPFELHWAETWNQYLKNWVNSVERLGRPIRSTHPVFQPGRQGYMEGHYYDLRVAPLFEEFGRVGGVYITLFEHHPVSEKGNNGQLLARRPSQAEVIREQLRDSDLRYRLVAEASNDFIWDWNLVTDEVIRNEGIRKVFGYTPEQLRPGAAWGWAQIHIADRRRVMQGMQTALDDGSDFWEDEYFYRRANGTYVQVHCRAQIVRDSIGKAVRMVGSVRDITEQKRAEEALNRDRAELERLVWERTWELEQSHERLRLSERLASLGTLSAGLGHDMGNLLVPVRVRVEALERADLPPEALEDVRAIKISAEYLQRLANGLRLLAVDPKKTYVGEATELRAWWNDACGVLRTILPRGVVLQDNLPEGECWVEISKTALTQVVFNLVQNAGDALRGKGEGIVSLSAEQIGEKVRLFIADDGPGMSPDVKARCMEPFYTTKARGISTGLGLVLVYGLIKEARGSVEIDTELGKGTTFVLTLDTAKTESTEIPRRDLKTAVIDVKDARLRAFITTILGTVSVRLLSKGDPAPHILVTDDSDHVSQTAAKVILIGELSDEKSGVLSLGKSPKPQELRDALRKAAKE